MTRKRLDGTRRHRQLYFEALEARRLLFVSWSFEDGTLLLTGGNDADILTDILAAGPPLSRTVRYTTNGIAGDVTINTGIDPINLARIIIITTGLGADEIDLQAGLANIAPLELLLINAGGDDDIVHGVPAGEVIHPDSPLSQSAVANIHVDLGAGMDSFDGGDDPESVLGGLQKDSIYTYGGNDVIDGEAGDDDILDGGQGDDTVQGGDGSDDVRGDAGFDRLFGDTQAGGACQVADCGDVIRGGGEFDIIRGGPGDDEIVGEGDNDLIYGGSGGDTISGGGGTDEVFGESGGDTITGGDQPDYLWSNMGPGTQDQPYKAVLPAGGIAGSPDMDDTGQGACDNEDGHGDDDAGCPPVGGLPVAVSDAYTDGQLRDIDESSPGVLANDLGTSLSAVLVTDVSHGTLSLNSDGSFSYTPDSNFFGVDYFQYRSTDGTNDSNVATVTLTMVPPTVIAADDENYLSVEGSVVNENVLDNDTSATMAIYVAGSGPSAGSLTFNADGSFSYTPPGPGYGYVTFQYIAVHTASGAQDGPATVTITYQDEPLLFDGPEGPGNVPSLTRSELDPLFLAAVDRWRTAGVSDQAIAELLGNVRLVIADLSANMLGAAGDGVLFVDYNGAGHGWFVDATPYDDAEFQRQTFATERVALAGSPAHGYVDLLTVLEHEIGHLLGADHSDRPGSVMEHTLGLSTRRRADAVDAAIVELMYEASQRERRR
jgi:hypothetical protein